MKISKRITVGIFALTACLSFAAPVSAFSYKDVPKNHWAYYAIDQVSNAGIIVGDLSGNFSPDASLDKFETAKILAKMAGYNYTDATAAQQAEYNSIYEKYRSAINSYAAKYNRWNGSADKEIAFLLNKGVLTQDDLDQFIILLDGQERLRALSREEVSIYLTRFMSRSNVALSSPYTGTFNDDASITASAKPYVYYLKTIGIFTGDDRNNFNPKNPVTKAAMAVLAQKTLLNVAPQVFSLAPDSGGVASGNTTSGGQTTSPVGGQSFSGTIAKLFPTFKSIQITSADVNYNNRIYPLSANATITINGVNSDFSNLLEGMAISGTVAGGEITSVSAMGAQGGGSVTNPVDTSGMNNLDGTVSSVNFGVSGNYVSIETRMLTPNGSVVTESKSYLIPSNCSIFRAGVATNYQSITKGDLIKAQVSGSTVYKIELEEKTKSFMGTLEEKKENSDNGFPVFVIKDKNGKLTEYTLDKNSYIYRKGSGQVSPWDIRLGDSVDVKTEYNKITEIYAYGSKTSADVWVKDIFISDTVQSIITGIYDDGEEEKFAVITGNLNVYDLRVGSKLRLRLDSREVESLSVLQEAKTSDFTGYITSFSNGKLTVRNAGGNYENKDFTFDSATIITDSTTGKKVEYKDFKVGTKLFITFSSSNASYAKSITILTY